MRVVAMAVILTGAWTCGPAVLRAGQAADPRPTPTATEGRTSQSTEASRIASTYCAGCHNGTMRSPSGALLDQIDPSTVGSNPDLWTRAYRQLQAGTMPPVGAKRPDRSGYEVLLTAIERGLGADTAPPAATSSQEIAERLALMLWNSEPDTALLDLARGNRLRDDVVLEQQVVRMLSDGRAAAFIARFFVPWLGLDRLATAAPGRAHFPDYDVSLRDAMTRETELFVMSQLRDDRDPLELWSAGYTFLNEQLARHYGIAGVTGTEFRRVMFSAPERAGLLGQGSVLMVTSRHSDRPDGGFTSPASRSIWVRQHYFGVPPPRPFPGAQPVDPTLPITPQTRALPAQPCVTCHRNFFPLGYALEHFDSLGRWRTHDQAGPVDASGSFVDGTPTDGVVALRSVLLQHPDAFRTAITEKLIVFASGGPASASRMAPDTLIRARQVLHSAPVMRWSSIIARIVRSQPLPVQ